MAKVTFTIELPTSLDLTIDGQHTDPPYSSMGLHAAPGEDPYHYEFPCLTGMSATDIDARLDEFRRRLAQMALLHGVWAYHLRLKTDPAPIAHETPRRGAAAPG
jgi:hypothetical protein